MEQKQPKKTLDEYINERISNKSDNPYFDENGNSPRAVVMRMRNKGVMAAIKWETKDYFNAVKDYVLDFRGLDTPIGYFLCLILLPFLVIPSPILKTYFRYKQAIDEYKQEYIRKYPNSQT